MNFGKMGDNITFWEFAFNFVFNFLTTANEQPKQAKNKQLNTTTETNKNIRG